MQDRPGLPWLITLLIVAGSVVRLTLVGPNRPIPPFLHRNPLIVGVGKFLGRRSSDTYNDLASSPTGVTQPKRKIGILSRRPQDSTPFPFLQSVTRQRSSTIHFGPSSKFFYDGGLVPCGLNRGRVRRSGVGE